jgi:hypothetical protein
MAATNHQAPLPAVKVPPTLVRVRPPTVREPPALIKVPPVDHRGVTTDPHGAAVNRFLIVETQPQIAEKALIVRGIDSGCH